MYQIVLLSPKLSLVTGLPKGYVLLYFTKSFDNRSKRCNVSLMPPIYDPESTLCSMAWMNEPSLCTVHNDISDNNVVTGKRIMFLNSDGFKDRNGGKPQKMERMETRTGARLKAQVDSVFPSKSKLGNMISAQVVCTKAKLVEKETSSLVAESVEEILQWATSVVTGESVR